MNDSQLKQMMNELKKNYDRMPEASSSDRIIDNLKKKKRNRWRTFFRGWQVAAALLVALGIGGVLFSDQFIEMSIDEVNESGDNNTVADKERMFTEERAEQSIETETEESQTFDTSLSEEGQTETIVLEGMEEVIDVRRISDNELEFSTFVDARYDINSETSDESYSMDIYANYVGETIKPYFFRVSKYNHSLQGIKELETHLHEVYTSSGYVEQKSDGFFDRYDTGLNFISETKFEQSESTVYIGILQHEESYYTVTANLIGERAERNSADIGIILKHAQFE